MSWEAWGDDDAKTNDEILPNGWWDEDTVDQVQTAIKLLKVEQMYQYGMRKYGISVRFLARITMLERAAGMLEEDDPKVVDAKNVLAPQ